MNDLTSALAMHPAIRAFATRKKRFRKLIENLTQDISFIEDVISQLISGEELSQLLELLQLTGYNAVFQRNIEEILEFLQSVNTYKISNRTINDTVIFLQNGTRQHIATRQLIDSIIFNSSVAQDTIFSRLSNNTFIINGTVIQNAVFARLGSNILSVNQNISRQYIGSRQLAQFIMLNGLATEYKISTRSTTSNLTFIGSSLYQKLISKSSSSTLLFTQLAEMTIEMIDPGVCYGRLTLTSGTPVTTSDVTGATTLYFTPYLSNRISTYNGTVWDTNSFAEQSLLISSNIVVQVSLTASTTNGSPVITGISSTSGMEVGSPVSAVAGIPSNAIIKSVDSISQITMNVNATATGSRTVTIYYPQYDVFWNNGSLTLTAWGNNTRITTLVKQDGVYLRSDSLTQRYLGTIRLTSASTCEDSQAKCFVYNNSHRVLRFLKTSMTSGSHIYGTSTFRSYNADNTIRFEYVNGLVKDPIIINIIGQITSGGILSVGINTTSASSLGNPGQLPYNGSGSASDIGGGYFIMPSLGYSYAQAIQSGQTGSSFFEGVLVTAGLMA